MEIQSKSHGNTQQCDDSKGQVRDDGQSPPVTNERVTLASLAALMREISICAGENYRRAANGARRDARRGRRGGVVVALR